MKKLLLFIFALTTLSACTSSKNAHSTQKKYIPEAFHAVHLGMSKADALKARPNMKLANDSGFRTEYIEEIDDAEVTHAVYYFDDDAPQVLYEIILVYKASEMRDNVAATLLGEPNSENKKEWYFDSKEEFKIHCWAYKNKLIIAGEINGTEWEQPTN